MTGICVLILSLFAVHFNLNLYTILVCLLYMFACVAEIIRQRIQTPAIFMFNYPVGIRTHCRSFPLHAVITCSVTEVIFMLHSHFLEIGKFLLWLTMSFCCSACLFKGVVSLFVFSGWYSDSLQFYKPIGMHTASWFWVKIVLLYSKVSLSRIVNPGQSQKDTTERNIMSWDFNMAATMNGDLFYVE